MERLVGLIFDEVQDNSFLNAKKFFFGWRSKLLIEMGPDLTQTNFWSAANKRPTCLWPGYFLIRQYFLWSEGKKLKIWDFYNLKISPALSCFVGCDATTELSSGLAWVGSGWQQMYFLTSIPVTPPLNISLQTQMVFSMNKCTQPENCHTGFGKNYTIVENVVQYTNDKIPKGCTQYL